MIKIINYLPLLSLLGFIVRLDDYSLFWNAILWYIVLYAVSRFMINLLLTRSISKVKFRRVVIWISVSLMVLVGSVILLGSAEFKHLYSRSNRDIIALSGLLSGLVSIAVYFYLEITLWVYCKEQTRNFSSRTYTDLWLPNYSNRMSAQIK